MTDNKRKTKLVKISLIIAFAILVITALALGLIFGLKKKPKDTVIVMDTKNNNYVFAMKESDEEFTIPMEIFDKNSPDDFDINIKVIEEYIILEKNKIKIIKKLPQDSINDYERGNIQFVHNGDIYITVSIQIFRRDVIEINTLEDFKSIGSNAEGMYIQRNPIDLSQESDFSIKGFQGQYYGNHNIIKGLDVSKSKGLFVGVRNAVLAGIKLVDFKARVVGAPTESNVLPDSESVGLLASSILNSDVISVDISGSLEYQNKKEHNRKIVNIGGIIGSVKVEGQGDFELVGCKSNVVIIVRSSGQSIHIGGIVGNSKDYSIQYCRSFGKINYSYSEEGASSLFVGGIAGFLSKKVDSFDKNIPIFMGYNIESSIDIDVKVTNDAIKMSVGGLFGNITNYQLNTIRYEGAIRVDCTNSDLYSGNIAGEVVNNVFSESDTRAILFLNIHVNNSIVVSSDGILRLGTVIGSARSNLIPNRFGIICSDYSAPHLSKYSRKTEVGESKATANYSPIGLKTDIS